MDGGCRSYSDVSAWILILLLMAPMAQIVYPQDTTPPSVTCDDVTTLSALPNTFLGLDEGVTYTYFDVNSDPSGITYNVSEGPGGDLFPPGRTPVTMFAVDLFHNMATCLFYVENPLTELPVECPNINGTVATYIGLNKYTFNVTIGPDNVTKSTAGYRYHGNDVSVVLTAKASPIGSIADLGTYVLTISDDVLSMTCEGPIVILGRITVLKVAIIIGVVIAVIMMTVLIISIISYRSVKTMDRYDGADQSAVMAVKASKSASNIPDSNTTPENYC